MDDIFISYAREDRLRAEELARALEDQGWSVFWDRQIPAGQTWRTYVGTALEAARCVVVAWSASSVGSHWVHEEADDGRQRGILVPVFFERVQPPLGFRSVQAADLSGWDGTAGADSFALLARAVAAVLGTSAAATRPNTHHPPKPPVSAENALNPPVWIEGGTFTMGGVAKPIHSVTLSGFWIQQHPVTNEEYARFASEHRFPAGMERHPVVNVDWHQAAAYAASVRGCLPTEAQWEFAARGTEGRTYPWGEAAPSCRLAHYWGCYPEGTVPVMSRPEGATPEGVHDLAGNVWEWVADLYERYADEDATNPRGPESSPWGRVLRGGSFGNSADYLRSSDRNNQLPDQVSDAFGFRVAWGAGED